MKIKWHISIGLVGCQHEGEFEIDDNATEEEIEHEARETAFDHIEWSWWKADEDKS